MLATAGLAAGWCASSAFGLAPTAEAETEPRFRIGACDWSMGCSHDLGAFALARQIGLDGVEIGFNGKPPLDLRDKDARRQYLQASKEHGVEICSLSLSVFSRVLMHSDPEAEKWLEDCVDLMIDMGVKLALIPFFFQGDIRGNQARQDTVVRRLKRIAPNAEKAGIVLALETWLNADDHARILDRIGSESVKVYYDVSNMLRQGYDIYREIRQLGDRIARFHMKEKRTLLGQGDVDFPKVKEAIDEIGYRGWLVIEGGTVKGRSIADCQADNVKYLRSVFPTGQRG